MKNTVSAGSFAATRAVVEASILTPETGKHEQEIEASPGPTIADFELLQRCKREAGLA